MLKTLIIRNFVLIDELHIELDGGLTVITGETGAGKSILLGAIGLLMGQRADSSSILPGAERCVIEAHFEGLDSEVDRILASEDIESAGDDLIIRREINIKGKSRAFVNDSPASLSLLKQLSEYLIDIHSQHKNLLLGDAQFQLSVLDLYGGHKALIQDYSKHYKQWRLACKRLNELRELQQEALREQDYLQFQFDQLDQADLRLGELEELESEGYQLTHAMDIQMGLGRAYSSLEDDEMGALQGLRSAIDALHNIQRFYPDAESLIDRLKSTRIELQDISGTLEGEVGRVEYDPDRLLEVNARLDLLNNLLHRHSVSDIGALIAIYQEIDSRLQQIGSSEEEILALEQEVAYEEHQAKILATELRDRRTKVATEIERALISSLQDLGMPHVRFDIRIDELRELTANGIDQVTFLFSANKDIQPEPVADIASGGEISRLMLSVKALIADRRHLPTIIFDEIDTGVSGDIADKIGLILRQMGDNMQVMAVTHLPQIAAAGQNHFYIYKEHGQESTRSHLRQLTPPERIEEIARMQSGSKLTEVSLAAARELFESVQTRH